MAQLRGPGAMTGVNLVVRAYDNSVTKNGKSQYADVMLDHRHPGAKGQTNLHLISEKVKDANGKERHNNGAPYSIGQMEAIKQAAGPNQEPILNVDGETVGTAYGVKANLMSASENKGLVINTKTLEQSDFKIDGQTLDNQFASMKEARLEREAAEAAKATEAQAPEAETAQPEPVLAGSEPEVG